MSHHTRALHTPAFCHPCYLQCLLHTLQPCLQGVTAQFQPPHITPCCFLQVLIAEHGSLQAACVMPKNIALAAGTLKRPYL